MAQYKITVGGKGLRKATVDKIASQFKARLGEGGFVNVVSDDSPTSRADEFDLARTMVEDAKGTAEELRDSLQDWYNNLPDQFQSGDKGDQLELAISQLDDFISHCESAADCDVDFPGMY